MYTRIITSLQKSVTRTPILVLSGTVIGYTVHNTYRNINIDAFSLKDKLHKDYCSKSLELYNQGTNNMINLFGEDILKYVKYPDNLLCVAAELECNELVMKLINENYDPNINDDFVIITSVHQNNIDLTDDLLRNNHIKTSGMVRALEYIYTADLEIYNFTQNYETTEKMLWKYAIWSNDYSIYDDLMMIAINNNKIQIVKKLVV
jgi:hypothetical protein